MWAELHHALTAGAAVIVHGATAGWSAWLAAQLPADGEADGRADDVVVVVAPDDQVARRLEADIRFFRGGARDPAAALDEIAALPGIDVSPYADLSPDRGCIVERVATLYRLTQPALRPRIVVSSAEALVRRTVAPGELAARGTTLRKGETVDREELAALLIAGGWARTPVVDEPGTFAVRGGVIDRLRAARAAPGAHRAVRRRGRDRCAGSTPSRSARCARSSGSTSTRCARRSTPARATCGPGCASTPTRSRSRPRRPGG